MFTKKEQSSGKEMLHFKEMLTSNPLKYKMDYSIFIVLVYMGKFIRKKRVKN